MKASNITMALGVLTLATRGVVGSTLTLSIQSADPSEVNAGQAVRVEILATFEAPLTACAFDLESSGTSFAAVEARLLSSIKVLGMALLSRSSWGQTFVSR